MIPRSVFLVSKSDISELSGSIMTGYGISQKNIIFGTNGLRDLERRESSYEVPNEGRFCGIFIQGKHAIIRTDSTGQELLFLFESGEYWCVSNSFMVLLNHVSKSHQLELNPIPIHGLHLKNGRHIGEQLISHRTMVNSIRVLPITSHLQVDMTNGKIKEIRVPYLEMFPRITSDEYVSLMSDFLSNGIGIIQAFRDLGLSSKLLLSGGYDSRLVLCMFLETKSQSPVRIQSFTHKKDDLKVATSLCKLHNLSLNSPGPSRRNTISPKRAMDLHEMSSFGAYLPFYYPISDGRQSDFEMVLTGDQPTGWSHFAGNYLFNGDAKKIHNDILNYLSDRGTGEIVASDFLTTFDELGIDPEDPAAMMMHYSSIRSRFHCGRHWAKSLGNQYLVTPLTQSTIISLDMFNAINGYHPTKFFIDAYSAFDDWALSQPFETPDRALDKDLIQTSPMANRGKIQPTKFQIYGDLNDPPYLAEGEQFGTTPLTDEMMRDQIRTMFKQVNKYNLEEFFTSEDFRQAEIELEETGRLSQDYRKTMHIISTDKIQKIIQSTK